MGEEREKLGSLLVKYGLITEDDLNEGLKLQRLMGLKLGETLVKAGKINEENIQWVLSKQFDLPFVIVEHIQVDENLLQKLPKNFLFDNKILPILETDDEICIVTDDIFNYGAFSFIENVLSKKVNISVGEGKKIEDALMRFLKKDAEPSFLALLQDTMDRIKDTSFYRVDITICENSFEIGVYGIGIIKKIAKINTALKKEDVFRAFYVLKIPFLYSIHDNFNRAVFLIYPLTNIIQDIKYPAILGINGLILPQETTFSDMQGSEIEHLIIANRPVYGYPYLSLNNKSKDYEKTIYIPDSMPSEFTNFYVKIHAPDKCSLCNSNGCEKCKGLGYTFRTIEGIYSSDELIKVI